MLFIGPGRGKVRHVLRCFLVGLRDVPKAKDVVLLQGRIVEGRRSIPEEVTVVRFDVSRLA